MHPPRRPNRIWRTVTLTLAASLLTLVLPIGPAAANLHQELQEKQRELESTQEAKRAAQGELADRENRLRATQAEVRQAETALSELEEEIVTIDVQLSGVEAALSETEQRVTEIEDRADTLRGRLAARVRTAYMDGTVDFLAVLFKSSSFGDFLSRWEFLVRITEHDAELLREARATEQEWQARRATLLAERDAARQLRADRAAKAADLVACQADAAARARLAGEIEELRRKLAEFDAQTEASVAEIAALQRRAARQAGQLAFRAPLERYFVTDDYGPRIHPILGTQNMHTGVDMAANHGEPVYAAEDGTVVLSNWYGGYGKAVVIDHGSSKGRLFATLYAHNSELLVTAGQQVRRGELIARVGSTGMSTGPHVHFEVRVDGAPVNPWDWLPS